MIGEKRKREREKRKRGTRDVVRVSIGPKLSTGSPSTLKIHPKVALPTGMLKGALVSITSIPLIRPSVALIAIALTQLFPNNCCTSQVTLIC